MSGLANDNEEIPQYIRESGLVPNNEYPAVPRGEWSSGVFGCFEHVPSCVTTCLCMCITAGQVRFFTPLLFLPLLQLSVRLIRDSLCWKYRRSRRKMPILSVSTFFYCRVEITRVGFYSELQPIFSIEKGIFLIENVMGFC